MGCVRSQNPLPLSLNWTGSISGLPQYMFHNLAEYVEHIVVEFFDAAHHIKQQAETPRLFYGPQLDCDIGMVK